MQSLIFLLISPKYNKPLQVTLRLWCSVTCNGGDERLLSKSASYRYGSGVRIFQS